MNYCLFLFENARDEEIIHIKITITILGNKKKSNSIIFPNGSAQLNTATKHSQHCWKMSEGSQALLFTTGKLKEMITALIMLIMSNKSIFSALLFKC